MTKITVSNKELEIKKVGENFQEGAFQVVAKDKVVFTASTNKACVRFLMKNKEVTIEVPEVENEVEFFKVGDSYEVYIVSTCRIKKFKCTDIDLDNLIVYGSYDGGKIKRFEASPVYKTMLEEKEGKSPSCYSIKVNERLKLNCLSKDIIK